MEHLIYCSNSIAKHVSLGPDFIWVFIWKSWIDKTDSLMNQSKLLILNVKAGSLAIDLRFERFPASILTY